MKMKRVLFIEDRPDRQIQFLAYNKLNTEDINSRFMDYLNKLAPYGPGNMRPSFASKRVEIVGNPRVVGKGEVDAVPDV